MQVATALALILAVLMALFAVNQLDTMVAPVQAVTSGVLSDFIAILPYLAAGLVALIAVAFVMKAISR